MLWKRIYVNFDIICALRSQMLGRASQTYGGETSYKRINVVSVKLQHCRLKLSIISRNSYYIALC